MMSDNLVFIRNMMYDGMLGFAIGDALGVPIRNSERRELRLSPLDDMIGYGYYRAPIGTWSENTSLMLSSMDSIIENEDINYEDIMFKMFDWKKYNNYQSEYEVFNLSDANKNAISNYRNGSLPVECGDNMSNDSSCLSRIVPIIYYLNSNNYTLEEEVSIINDVCSISHLSDVNKLGCMILNDYVKQLLNGVDKFEALNFIRNREYNKYYSDDCINLYNRILNEDISKVYKYNINSTDNIVDTLEASLWSFLNNNNYEDSLVNAINLGDNTNMIGALTGLFCGISYGNQKIPRRWFVKLKGKEFLYEMCIRYNELLDINKNGRTR